MALILYPGTDYYTGITVSGLYDNNTESPLFAAVGTTVPTSGIAIGGSQPIAGGTGFQLLSLDQSANTLTFPGIQFVVGTPVWDVTTTVNTHQFNNGTATEGPKTGAPAYLIQLDQSAGTFTTGAVTFEGTYDNVNWVAIPVSQILDPNTFAQQTNPYTFVSGVNKAFLILSQGYAQIRLTLSTALTALDTGTVTTYWSSLSYVPQISSMTAGSVQGTLTNDNASPIGNNIGSLGFIAESAYTNLTYTTGFQVLAATDLHGAIYNDMAAVAGVAIGPTSVVNFGSSPAAAPVQAVNSSIFSGTTSITNTGGALNVNVTGSTGTTTVAGTLSNNTAAPIADNVGVLPAIAATSYTTNTYTNGNQVLLVTDLNGALNSDVQAVAGVQLGATAVTAFGTAPAAVNVPAVNSSIFSGTTAITNTAGSLNVNITNTTVPVAGSLTNNNAAPTTNNIGSLDYIATATPEAYTQGNQVLATTSLGGAVRVVPVDEANASSLSYFEVTNGNAYIPVTTAFTPVIAFQSNTAGIIYLLRVIQFFTGGQVMEFTMLKNPTVTGGTFAAASGHFNLNTTATSYSGGTKVLAGYVGSVPYLLSNLLDAVAAGAPGDTFAIQARTFSGSGSAVASVRWSEQAAAL